MAAFGTVHTSKYHVTRSHCAYRVGRAHIDGKRYDLLTESSACEGLGQYVHLVTLQRRILFLCIDDPVKICLFHTIGINQHELADPQADELLGNNAAGTRAPDHSHSERSKDSCRSLAEGLRVTQTMTLMTIGLYNDPEGAWLPSVLY